MMKLYRKNEVLFAVLWIVVYVVVCGNLRSLGDDSPYMTIGLAAISAAMLLFVARNGLVEKYGLARWVKNSRHLLYFVPLLIVVSGNLWDGFTLQYAGFGLACAIISMLLVGFAEELLFRGFLFRAMLADGNATVAIIVSSLTFGIGHIFNLLLGQPFFETSVQIVFAVAVGLMFTLVYYKGGSLLPCIVAHGLVDVFALFSDDVIGVMDWVSVAVCIVVALAYSAYLWRIEPPASMR